MDGFTISKSYYTNGYDYDNGAIHIECLGNPTIRNCTIKDNFGCYGGGICIRNSDPLIINNTISRQSPMKGLVFTRLWY
ncbi:MAG: right-handed parallel beta-helix repeat-containing protein [Bacteroidetes bacterium]|nr:right-handed parallel beta-helix repeat-containing protein [Bacteroidota bacterium]